MAKEIERKFLVISSAYQSLSKPIYFHQGYMSTDPARSVRVRIEGDTAKITIKGKTKGFTRDEFEYTIPADEAQYMLQHLCLQPTIEKYRYKIQIDDLLWEVDEFVGVNEGLIMAEVELATEDSPFTKPHWIGTEVTGDTAYYNMSLVNNPFKNWNK